MDNLKHKTLKALYWSGIDSFGIYFLKFGFSIAITRLLTPEDYGLVGMIAIFIGIGTMLTESGFSMALIQKKNVNQEDFSTVFFFNITIALLLYFLFFIAAEQIAIFYHEPRLILITRVTSLNIIFSAFNTVQVAILAKNLNFKIQAKISAISVVISGSIGLVMSYAGFTVWALIFQMLSGQLIGCIFYWSLKEWRPGLEFSWKSFKELYKYASKIFLQGLANTFFGNIYLPIIGKKFSTGDLGLYTRATRFSDVFVKQVTIAYGRVMFPAFSSIQDQRERFTYLYEKTVKLLAFLIFPIMMGLIITAKPFVSVVLTEKWLPAVPFIQLFYLEGFFYPIYMLNLNIFNALGKSEMSLKIEVLKKGLLLISIFLTLGYGIQGLIAGQLASSFIVFVVGGYFVGREINYSLMKQFTAIAPSFFITLLSFAMCYFIIPRLVKNYFLLMSLYALFGLFLYFLTFSIFRIHVYLEFKRYISPYIPERIKYVF
ncbi:MAG TPA: lipopolysaccharide biosynthesis protein [Candidatus Deferrimicrobium sp.]|nr:lipopolysaccharide biosynthesis protein [Candidatus Deferrimicrobium sp.]